MNLNVRPQVVLRDLRDNVRTIRFSIKQVLRAAIVVFAALLSIPTFVSAQGDEPSNTLGSGTSAQSTDTDSVGQWWLLRNRDYYDPLFAEPQAAIVKVLFPGFSDPVPFSTATGTQLVWNISVGKEMPIFGYESGSAQDHSLAPGKWGFGVWFPLAFHMIEYMRQPTNPILDTDYRFNGMIKFERNVAKPPKPGERQPAGRFVGLRLNVGHESTHLGDEFTIRARAAFPSTFERINVSYEYWEVGGSYAAELGRDFKNLLTFRAGWIGLLNPSKGFFDYDPIETGGRVVLPSTRNEDPYVGVQWDCENGETAGCFTNKLRVGQWHSSWDPFVSADRAF